MHYGKQVVKTTYNMEGGGIRKDLEVREDEKDLIGVTFDPSLKFSKHVTGPTGSSELSKEHLTMKMKRSSSHYTRHWCVPI